MEYSLYQNTLAFYILLLFVMAISPVNMQTITIEIKDLQFLISSSLDRLFGEIDPAIDKCRNLLMDILSIFETRIKANVSEIFYWLQTTLFILLFVTIIFLIFIFILLNLLDILLIRYEYTIEKRRSIGLAIVTLISVWLLIAMILSTWPRLINFDLQTLKYVSVILLISIVLYLVLVWIYHLYGHFKRLRHYQKSHKKSLKEKSIQRMTTNLEDEQLFDI